MTFPSQPIRAGFLGGSFLQKDVDAENKRIDWKSQTSGASGCGRIEQSVTEVGQAIRLPCLTGQANRLPHLRHMISCT